MRILTEKELDEDMPPRTLQPVNPKVAQNTISINYIKNVFE